MAQGPQMKEAAARALSQWQGGEAPTAVAGRTCWGALSDAVICAECPDAAAIATSNLRHFAPLCQVLDRKRPLEP